MKCNNKHCYWNSFGQCCPESGELYENAKPNSLDCPSSLRSDFQEALLDLVDECGEELQKKSMKELIQIRKFMENQNNKTT
ncbi:hypothetical protein WKH56_20150 [Priestia sp. SB1]|uniref:hypothetical protein n=1 Tax=Priestia sp. SB1 TaxID=3132359 RepID=UPI003180C04F